MKTLKRILTLAVIAIMAFSLFACSAGAPAAEEPSGSEAAGTDAGEAAAGSENTGEKKTLKIGFSWRSLDEGMTTWWDGTEAAIKEYNEGDNPYTIEYFFTNAESGVDKQISDVESLIVREPDVICIQAVDANGSVPAYEACVEAGIPVVDFGYNVNYDQCTTVYKTIDHYKAGELQAEWVNNYLEENPDATLQVGYILGLAGVEDMTVRMNGFIENANPDKVTVVATKNCDFQASLAQSTAEDWMQAFPEMNTVVACNDEMCVGALQAFKSADTPVIALGLDGGVSALQEIADGSMAATVAFDFNVMAVEGVNLAIGVASGEYTDPVFDVTQTASVLIDASNVQDYL